MSIPLVQNNEKDSINTSIIAIKRNIERINMLLSLVDSGSPDLSGFATKQELEDAITQVETDLAPVDEVTSGNMQSVTSNAVAMACPKFPDYASGNLITSTITSYTATQDCYVVFLLIASTNGNRALMINNVQVASVDTETGLYVTSFSGYIKKGSILKRADNNAIRPEQLKVYKLL